MDVLIAFLGALAAAAIPLALGFRRRGFSEAAAAAAFGLALPRRRFDPEEWARRTGTGLAFRQIALGGFLWMAAGFLAGLFLLGSPLSAVLLMLAAGFFYFGGLADRAAEFRMKQGRDLIRAARAVEAALSQGRGLEEALELALPATGPHGRMVMADLLASVRAAPTARERAEAVRAWTRRWAGVMDDLFGAALLSALEGDVRPLPVLSAVRRAMAEVMEILSRARAEARGLEIQAKALGIGPIAIVIFLIAAAGMAGFWSNPLYLLPVFAGSLLAYALMTRQIRTGLSPDSSVGLDPAGGGEIPRDRFGRPL
jgi:hypothetical protein